jgi:GH43 family beta-xylosidase
LDPAAWRKETKGPCFARTDEVFGPGHHSFFEVADGPDTGWWMVYHGTREPGRAGKGRELFAKRIGWGEDGLPVLGRAGETPQITGAQR